jgi:ABC-2 type transport system ATP-binding protein
MIDVQQVSKHYGSTVAVDNVSFRIDAGEVVGFLGPNGAGKSTVLKMISSWLPPTSGKILVAGHDVSRSPLAVREALGYLPEHNALYDNMRVLPFLRFVARLRGLAGAALAERLEWVVGATNLQDVLTRRINECSKGYRQRIGLAASLVHDPRVLLLDEPTHGLDPLQVVAFRDFVHGLREGRVLIINHGCLLADRTVESLAAEAQERAIDVEQVVLEIVERGSGGRTRALRGSAREATEVQA